jgi:hypothetical protein
MWTPVVVVCTLCATASTAADTFVVSSYAPLVRQSLGLDAEAAGQLPWIFFAGERGPAQSQSPELDQALSTRLWVRGSFDASLSTLRLLSAGNLVVLMRANWWLAKVGNQNSVYVGMAILVRAPHVLREE